MYELMARPVATVLVAKSAVMKELIELVARVAPAEANVLITGEPGTGKGLVAEALHAGSRRSAKALGSFNAGYCAEALFAREFFGVAQKTRSGRVDRKGVFELASGSTLFLDEIANVPLSEQGRLLRAVETGEFHSVGDPATRHADVRIVTATNASLKREVARGRFRADLLLRLNPIEIRVPPLRERLEDIPALAEEFLREHRGRRRSDLEGFDESAVVALTAHEWPGNVRELDSSIEFAVRVARGPLVTADDLKLRSWKEHSPRLEDLKLAEAERLVIQKALARFDEHAGRAARALGLSHRAFQRRRRRLGV
jgi:DNA-binding NtrC family response regulator